MFDIHASTAHLHFQGIDTAARPIVIDAAALSPGKFEIMAMRPDGREIECQTAYTLAEAEAVYAAMLAHHTQPAPPPRPLSGKYAALRDALREALRVGRAAEDADPEDGGTCNFDSAALHLPRWNAALVRRAAQEAGTSCHSWQLGSSRLWVFVPNSSAQANARSRNAEAMTRALAAMGYDAVDYSQMD